MPTSSKDLTTRRGTAKGSITRLVTYADTITERTPAADILTRLELLERVFNDFVEYDAQLVAQELPSEIAEYETKYLNVKTKFKQLLAGPAVDEATGVEKMVSRILKDQNEFLTTLSSSFTTSLNQTASLSMDEPHCSARLPRLNVPTFAGDYREFPGFKDLYIASVHRKIGLSDAEKFQYLRGYLRGEAADLIKHILVSEANYAQAWTKLCDRYDKRKYVLNDMIKQFIDQPSMQVGSVKKLRQLHNNADEVNRGIDALGGEAKYRDPWLIYLMLHKTDAETQLAWAHKTVTKEFPTFDEFLNFISERCDALESCDSIKPSMTRSQVTKSHQLMVPTSEECVFCKAAHKLHQCMKFKDLEVPERKQQAARLRVCFNCLASRHQAKGCLSQRRCSKCGRNHHSLLHAEPAVNHNHVAPDSRVSMSERTPTPSASNPPTIVSHAKMVNTCQLGGTILPTAIVKAQDQFGQFKFSNVLLDSGSQLSFISKKLLTQLGIRCKPGHVRVEGIATSTVTTLGSASLTICSRFDDSHNIKINALVLPKITTLSSCSTNIHGGQINHLSDLPLADPNYDKRKEIDILIGADYFFHILRQNQIEFTTNIIARETIFGYIIAGTANNDDSTDQLVNPKTLHINAVNEQPLEDILRKFWEQEDISDVSTWSSEEEICEKHFQSTVRRNQNGRYIVRLPLRESTLSLGHSYNTALQRLLSMERKFNRNPEFKNLYHTFMNEYLSLGHMRAVTTSESHKHNSEINILPHHGIIKETSTTTKLRVVFDGSAATSTGVSLNDKLMVGPTIQDTLWAILLRFRSFKVAVSADIEKMYRQILVDPSQTSLQRILWRNSTTEAVKQYELLTVTYGTSAAPYLATRVLRQLGDDCKGVSPHISTVIKRDFYVDDLLTGAETEHQAIGLKAEISRALEGAGFVLRKWRSNCASLNEKTENELMSIPDDGRISPILGLYWDSERDEFLFKIENIPCESYTKRNVLSLSARVFDPLGWLTPFTINLKLFMQQLWIRKVTWDDMLPPDLQEEWKGIHNQFAQLKSVTIQRYVGSSSEDIQLHGFSDSSESAYAASIYARIKCNGHYKVTLITAKSKAAPINQISLPRLELCGAHMLTKLMQRVLTAYDLANVPIRLWTDSTIVLAWLSDHPRRWKTYVANRVSAMHTALPQAVWRHVRGHENPSDLATRGIAAQDLIKNKLWFEGPKWLSSNEEAWPIKSSMIKTPEEARVRELNVMHTIVKNLEHPIAQMLTRFSKWSQLVRSLAYVLRFIHNFTTKPRLSTNISVAELEHAELTIIRYTQQNEFAEDICSLKKNKYVSPRSKLSSLAPFVDSQDTLRVGGRLQNACGTYDTKHPIVLPKHHPVTDMILRYLHTIYLHPGPSLLLALSRQRFWILGVREKCRTLCHKCIICFRNSTLRSSQQMGILPQARVTPSRPFSSVGIDYAGPIYIATKKGRGAKHIKGFMVIFVCFATKALHIEMDSDLTTDAFLAALDRFTARRGAPTDIYTDNGTNFIGAKRKIFEHYQLLLSKECQSEIVRYTTSARINWHLIPPISPHFGGIWERAVRSVKSHLTKVIGKAHLTYEEMETVLIRIEGILNSRPLCAIKNEDSSNIDTLTPAHFLTLGPITSIPQANYEEISMARLNRWELVRRLVNEFWRRYTITYLNTLQQRSKWQYTTINLKIDDVVLLQDNTTPPCMWPLGRVIELHPGTDGLIRVATVRTKSSTFKRPIAKLFKLPLED